MIGARPLHPLSSRPQRLDQVTCDRAGGLQALDARSRLDANGALASIGHAVVSPRWLERRADRARNV